MANKIMPAYSLWVYPLRCDVSSNPCGTDTEGNGITCQCDPCRGYRHIVHLEAELECGKLPSPDTVIYGGPLNGMDFPKITLKDLTDRLVELQAKIAELEAEILALTITNKLLHGQIVSLTHRPDMQQFLGQESSDG